MTDTERDYEEEKFNQGLLDNPEGETSRKWCFTFGFDHKMIPADVDSQRTDWDAEFQIPLSKRYVRLEGTRDATRVMMFKYFGNMWAFQYDEAEFQELIEKHGLKELKIAT